MAIRKHTSRVSRLEGDVSPTDGDSASSYDDEFQSQILETEPDDTDASEVDSGMGSDDYDLSELSEAGFEYCQVGNQSFLVPLDLYDLPNLSSVLSLETWNTCLADEERFSLAEYLPDMDEETFAQTLKELFSGSNFHFGNPVAHLFGQLKSGLCEPRVNMYRGCLTFFQRHQHYHQLQKYQNSMVGSLLRMRNAWENYAGYGIEERLRLLNILKSRRPLVQMKNHRCLAANSEDDEYGGNYWNKRLTDSRQSDPLRIPFGSVFNGNDVTLDVARHEKEQPKGILKISGTKAPKGDHSRKAGRSQLPRRLETKDRPSGSSLAPPRQYNSGLDPGPVQRIRIQIKDIDDDTEEQANEVNAQRTKKAAHASQLAKVASHKQHYFDSSEKGTYSEWNSTSMPKASRTGKLAGKRRKTFVEGPRSKGHISPSSGEMCHQPSHRLNTSPARATGSFSHNQSNVEAVDTLFKKNIETESSEQEGEEEYTTPTDEKFSCPSTSENHQFEAVKTAYALPSKGKKQHRQREKNSREFSPQNDQRLNSNMADTNAVPSRGKHKSRSVNSPAKTSSLSAKLSGEQEHGYNAVKKGKSEVGHSDGLGSTMSKVHSSKLKRRQIVESLDAEKHLNENSKTVDGKPKSANRGKVTKNTIDEVNFHENLNMALTECNLVTKKRKGKADDGYPVDPVDPVDVQVSPKRLVDDSNLIKKKAKKTSLSTSSCLSLASTDEIVVEKEPMDTQPEPLPTKKPFTLITPTVQTGFSFSIIHLLSAVRRAMVTPGMEDAMEIECVPERKVGRHRPLSEDNKAVASPSVNFEGGLGEQRHLPSLTVQDIVSRVRTNPGDPCILETQEPLQDLVRGVLKIFFSKTAPLGAKGWKSLVFYEKSTKSWTWIGPVPSSSDHDAAEEETSSEAWGVPHKMLVKLVDAFANWLKAGQETLKQIGSLPAPPVMTLPNLDEKERFKDLRAQKSLVTICPSSAEVKTYFRREEFLRYSVPDRAFAYTAADGRKSAVAPLRRGGGKPTSKARDHFMLKPGRPPHVTVLCLVRDAAARLPGSIGTRADVCTLIRDSQYLVEDVSDAQINSVVSGALDRLHYEQDPCVQFDGERKLWVYLHGQREEEDFEDDGTSSTKKWRRPRRDAAEHSEQVADLGHYVVEDQDAGDLRYEFSSDPNIDPSSIHAMEKPEHFCGDLRCNVQNTEPLIDSMQNGAHQGHPMGWEVLDMNPLQENQMLCQENSINDDFDDEPIARKRSLGLTGTSP